MDAKMSPERKSVLFKNEKEYSPLRKEVGPENEHKSDRDIKMMIRRQSNKPRDRSENQAFKHLYINNPARAY